MDRLEGCIVKQIKFLRVILTTGRLNTTETITNFCDFIQTVGYEGIGQLTKKYDHHGQCTASTHGCKDAQCK